MKVILSRKGFDSANGGIVSPILEDGATLSFPIPAPDVNTFSELEYGASKGTWTKNPVYDKDNILSNRKNNAKDPQTGIYYAGIWQELGLKESDACTAWCKKLLL